jgi:hypothetical protein
VFGNGSHPMGARSLGAMEILRPDSPDLSPEPQRHVRIAVSKRAAFRVWLWSLGTDLLGARESH